MTARTSEGIAEATTQRDYGPRQLAEYLWQVIPVGPPLAEGKVLM
jgi:hypothetical protein